MDRSQLLNDPEQALRLALDGRQARIWTTMPGIVTDVDLAKMTCSVQPAIQGTIENEDGTISSVNYPVLIHVPIVFPRAGNFIITLPLAAGDEVLVSWACRCIDAWWQSGGIGRPMEARMHDLSDGFAIPGPSSQPKIVSGISATAIQIRNLAGTAYIEIGADGKIKLVSASEIDLNGPLKVTGDVTVTGKIEATLDVKAGTASVPISLLTHTHTSATPGNPTSPPLP